MIIEHFPVQQLASVSVTELPGFDKSFIALDFLLFVFVVLLNLGFFFCFCSCWRCGITNSYLRGYFCGRKCWKQQKSIPSFIDLELSNLVNFMIGSFYCYLFVLPGPFERKLRVVWRITLNSFLHMFEYIFLKPLMWIYFARKPLKWSVKM